jgi:hypothetical protein
MSHNLTLILFDIYLIEGVDEIDAIPFLTSSKIWKASSAKVTIRIIIPSVTCSDCMVFDRFALQPRHSQPR